MILFLTYDVQSSLALHQTYWLFAYTHLEGVTDLIRGQVINDHVQDLLDVVVDEGLALVGNCGGHVGAQSLENVPTNVSDVYNLEVQYCLQCLVKL